MEVFEVHITCDESLHAAAKKLAYKTIAIDLLRPDGSVMRTEHMTSMIFKYPDANDTHPAYDVIKGIVDQMERRLKDEGVQIRRIKIESAPYDHYVDQSLYMEVHFETDKFDFPVSKNQKKAVMLATDREYRKGFYRTFKEIWSGKELELCLYDTFVKEDKDWFDLYFDEEERW